MPILDVSLENCKKRILYGFQKIPQSLPMGKLGGFRNQPQNSSVVCLPGHCVPRLALEIEKKQTLNSLTQIKLTYKLLPFNKIFKSYFLIDLWKAQCVSECTFISEKRFCN